MRVTEMLGRIAVCGLGLVGAITLGVMPARAQGPDILTYKGPDRDQKLLEGAKKEGQVVLYSALIANQALRPLAEAFMKKYPVHEGDLLARRQRGSVPEGVGGDARQQRGRRRGRGHGRRRVRGRGRVDACPTTRRASLEYPEKYRDPRSHWTVDAAQLFQHRLQHAAGAGRPGAEELRRPARSQVEGQDGLAHRLSQRHAAVPHRTSGWRGARTRRAPTS